MHRFAPTRAYQSPIHPITLIMSSNAPTSVPPMKNTALIVDFPSSRHSTATAVKTVRFSKLSQGKRIPYPSKSDNEKKSYNSEDYAHFQQVMLRVVARCSARLLAAKGTPQDRHTSEKHIIRCVGLDHLISRDVRERYQSIKDARKAHVQLVLAEQRWQRRSGVYSVGCIARVSMADSEAARTRAHKVAWLSASVH